MSCPYTPSEIPGYFQSVQACISGGGTECDSNETLNETLVSCNTEMQTIINGLNQSVIDLTITNQALKAQTVQSYNNNNVSGQLFMGYKQTYSTCYFRNWWMIFSMGLILFGIFHALSNTTEGAELKGVISKKINQKV